MTAPATPALVPVITRAGLAAVRNAQGDGLQATISAIAVGRGIVSGATFVGYAPKGTEAALVSEQARVPLLSGSQLGGVAGTDPIGFRVQAIVPAGGSYPINEIGFILSDGTLLALWSDPTSPVAFATTLADVNFAFDLFLEALPVGSLAITVIEPDVDDTTGILAALLRGLALQSVDIATISDRLSLRNL